MTRIATALVFVLLGVIGSGVGTTTAAAQGARPSATPLPESAEVAAGWAALARDDAGAAAAAAAAALGRQPRSLPAATLLVHAETRRAGGRAGLDAYDQWIGSRQFEDPYLLRVVALGGLRELARAGGSDDARRDAYAALIAAPDGETLAVLRPAAPSADVVQLEMSGRLGSEPAVRRLIAALTSASAAAERVRLIGALVGTRSALAVPPLVRLLADADPALRRAAADGLGRLGAAPAVPALRTLLKDPEASVRLAAACGLYRLRDGSGFAVIREVQLSGTSPDQASVLDATTADVDQAWLSTARRLLTDSDPRVRLLVARLIAPHDPGAATTTLQNLLADADVAIRDGAAQVFVERLVADYPTLRRFLRSDDPMTRVRAATRILELTR